MVLKYTSDLLIEHVPSLFCDTVEKCPIMIVVHYICVSERGISFVVLTAIKTSFFN